MSEAGQREELILGTRGSALALVQATMTEQALAKAFPELKVVRKIINTTGDRRTDVSLGEVAKIEGVFDKGVFIKELEIALEEGEIDIAVHSLKDLPTVLEEPFTLAGVLERAVTGDVLVSKQEGGLAALPKGAKVASSSVRRQRMLKHLRPDVEMVDIRGNVPTRLRKLAESEAFDSIILAQAGLVRLGYDACGTMSTEAGNVYGALLDEAEFLPAAGQGAVGIEIRKGDLRAQAVVAAISHQATWQRVTAEREFLRLLDAGCHTPVGVATQIFGDKLLCEAIVFDEENAQAAPLVAEVAGDIAEPIAAAERLFQSLSTTE